MGMGFGLMETLFPFFFITIFLIVVGTFIFMAVSGASQWRRNNQSPVLTVEARVVVKRADVSHRHGGGSMNHMHHSTTWYYATFEVESGDRMELNVTGQEYGLLAEGDRGRLTFQGTRYLGFERDTASGGADFH